MGRAKRSRKAEETAARVHQILGILRKWGIHTLGEFARLDQEKVGSRLGPEAVALWERAKGRSTRLLKFIQPPESFAESFEFEHEVETIEPLLFTLRRFLEQIAVRLSGVYLVAKEITLRINFSNKQSYERRFEIPQPTIDVDLLFRMLHTHLEDFKSDHPIVAVFLEAEPVKSVQQQFGLFETALRDPNRLGETLARLTGLLGAGRVGTPVLEETHRPDVFQIAPFTWQLDAGPENCDVEKMEGRAPASPRPKRRRSSALHQPGSLPQLQKARRAALRRFRPAPSASILFEKDKPVHLRSREISGAVMAREGSYLASGNWWDDKGWTRREWDLYLGNGAVLRCHESAAGWQVDGIYD
jgi:protein ImuB